MAATLADLHGHVGAVHRRAALVSVDITGFTALCDRLSQRGPAGIERISEILNSHFADLVQCIESRGGEVVAFAGDGLLAWWPSDEDPALALRWAAEAALVVRQHLHGASVEGVALHLRVGVACGAVVAERIGGRDQRWEALLNGPAVAAVAAAEKLAQAGEVVVDAGAWRLLGDAARGTAAGDRGFALAALTGSPRPLRPQALPSAEDGALEAYLPVPVRLRRADAASGWLAELRPVAVVFIALRGLDGAHTAVLHAALLAIQAVLAPLEGTLDKVVVDAKGTSVLTAFGLPPLAHEDDSARAILAAFAVLRALERRGIAASIGIASGRAFCGPIGPPHRRQYTLIGAVVNLAARLMQAIPAGLVCCAATEAAARNRIACRALPPLQLKGYPLPVAAWEPVAERRNPPRRRRSFGRDAELAPLLRALDWAGHGAGGTWLLIGEAGHGKTTMLRDLAAEAQVRGFAVWRVAGDAVHRSTPYHAWRPLLTALLGVDAAAADRHAQLRALLEAEPMDRGLAPLLAEALGDPMAESEESLRLSGALRADRTRELLLRALRAARPAQPLLLLVDDLQWCDSASTRLAAALAAAIGVGLVVATTRPGEGGEKALAEATPLVLAPLPDDAIAALVADRLGDVEVSAADRALMVSRAEGNPFFAESMAVAVRERRRAAAAVDADQGDSAVPALPTSLVGVIAARIDRLEPVEQLTLKVASVLGRSFAAAMLAQLLPTAAAREGLPASLQRLQRHGLLAPLQGDAHADWTFRQSLVRDVAYGLMVHAQRVGVHAAAARWYERGGAPDLDRHAALLSHHHSAAGQPAQALGYLERSSELALRAGAFAEAQTLATRCVALVEELRAAGRPPSLLRQVRAHRLLASALAGLGDLRQSGSQAQASLALAAPLRYGRAAVTWQIAQLAVAQFLRIPRREPAGSAEAVELQRERAQAWQTLSTYHFFDNDALAMIRAILAGTDAAERIGPSEELARAWMTTAVLLGLAPVQPLAQRYARRAMALAAQLDQPATTAWVQLVAGLYFVGQGQWGPCGDSLRASQAAALQLQDGAGWGNAQAILTWIHHYRGDDDEVGRHARALLSHALHRTHRQQVAWAERFLATLALHAGQADLAVPQLQGVLRVVEEEGDSAERLLVLGCLALAWARLRCWEPFRETAAQTVALAAAMKPPTSHVVIEGCSCLARALAEARDAGQLSLEAWALQAAQALERCARVYAVARPWHLWALADLQARAGRRRAAQRQRLRALALAERLGTPRVAVLLRQELAGAAALTDR